MTSRHKLKFPLHLTKTSDFECNLLSVLNRVHRASKAWWDYQALMALLWVEQATIVSNTLKLLNCWNTAVFTPTKHCKYASLPCTASKFERSFDMRNYTSHLLCCSDMHCKYCLCRGKPIKMVWNKKWSMICDANPANCVNSVARIWNVQIFVVGARPVGGQGDISGIDAKLCDI